MIIAISGKQRSGKDTLGALLQQYLPTFKLTPLAGALKQEYAQLAGVTTAEVEQMKEDIRGDLIRLGHDRRSDNERYWVDKVLKIPGHKIVTDLRFRNEYNAFQGPNTIFVRVEAARDIRADRGNLSNEGDPSETDLDRFDDQWDFIVVNDDSLNSLDAQAQEIAFYVVKNMRYSLPPPKRQLSWWDGLILQVCGFFEKVFADLAEMHARRIRGFD